MIKVTFSIIVVVAVLALCRLLRRAKARGQYEEACEDRLIEWCVPPRG